MPTDVELADHHHRPDRQEHHDRPHLRDRRSELELPERPRRQQIDHQHHVRERHRRAGELLGQHHVEVAREHRLQGALRREVRDVEDQRAASACSTSSIASAVSCTRRPIGASSGTPASRSSTSSWREMVDGL